VAAKEALITATARLRLARLALPAALLCAVLASACSSDGDTSAGQAPTPESTATATVTGTQPAEEPTEESGEEAAAESAVTPTQPANAGPAEVDGQRIFATVEHLANVIGPRPAGTPKEVESAEWLSEQLESYGYTTELQSFTFQADIGGASIRLATGDAAQAIPLEGSPAGIVEGPLAYVGLAGPDDLDGVDLSGRIAVADRGTFTFSEKAAGVANAGATALIVINNESGFFLGELDQDSDVPVVGVQGEERLPLMTAGNEGVVATVEIAPPGETEAMNVVARTSDEPCRFVIGGHYDTVEVAPGALDNASGTATVLEIARVVAARGDTAGKCFVLFGAEERGLFGSKAYVDQLSDEERDALAAMLNFDVTGTGGSAVLSGSGSLVDVALGLAKDLDVNASEGDISASDHATFMDAGFDAVMFSGADFSQIHTPDDLPHLLDVELLEETGELGLATLEGLAAQP
jgi:aminopeptidase YwaD